VSSSNPRIAIRCAIGIRSILESLTKARARCFRGANTTTRKRNTLPFGLFFSSSTDYIPATQPFMVNYIVDDMDALLERLKQEGVKIDAKRMDESYGRFAWIYDSDGNKIELWQPLPEKP
jgi:predicted enzyme related to lactoylglutathione lyase